MELDELRHVSKVLLGSKHRLEISAAVAAAPDEEIYGRAISERVGVADSQVWSELRRLEDAGLLERLPRYRGGSSLRFRRLPSAYWEWIWELVGDAGRPAAALERQLRAGESHTFEVRGALFAALDSWLLGPGRLAESRETAMVTFRKIVGMLNADGGTVLIGAVEDGRYARRPDGPKLLADAPRVGDFAVIGLLDPTFVRRGADVWERRFRDLLAHAVTPNPSLHVRVACEELVGREVGVITVRRPRRSEPFFLKEAQGAHYYVREGPMSRRLEGTEMVRHWRAQLEEATAAEQSG